MYRRVILYDETIKQITSKKKTKSRIDFRYGQYPGIKVDTGAKVLAGSPNEKITEGLDGLRERLKEYYKLGAKFTKWRGVYNISKIIQVDSQYNLMHMPWLDTLH